MSEELLKIADGLLAVSEGVRALAGKAHSCNCSKNQEEDNWRPSQIVCSSLSPDLIPFASEKRGGKFGLP